MGTVLWCESDDGSIGIAGIRKHLAIFYKNMEKERFVSDLSHQAEFSGAYSFTEEMLALRRTRKRLF